jgi:tetratricopeptide (TPR) repeat protein
MARSSNWRLSTSPGREAASRAIELRPDDALAHYALGMLHYSFVEGSIEDALSFFDRSVALDSKLGWVRLYRAHCLHDLGRWSEAARAYSDVDPSFLVGPKAWRYDLLREQRAWCLLQAGDRERALAELLAILHRYEGQPGLAKYQLLQELTAAAEGPLQAELSERLAHLKVAMCDD